jgi:hypothetical protein
MHLARSLGHRAVEYQALPDHRAMTAVGTAPAYHDVTAYPRIRPGPCKGPAASEPAAKSLFRAGRP